MAVILALENAQKSAARRPYCIVIHSMLSRALKERWLIKMAKTMDLNERKNEDFMAAIMACLSTASRCNSTGYEGHAGNPWNENMR